METPQLFLRMPATGRVKMQIVSGQKNVSCTTEMPMELARKLAHRLSEKGNHWCEDAWLIRRSPDGQSMNLTFYRLVWGMDRTNSVALTANEAHRMATDLNRWLMQVDRSTPPPISDTEKNRRARFMVPGRT